LLGIGEEAFGYQECPCNRWFLKLTKKGESSELIEHIGSFHHLVKSLGVVLLLKHVAEKYTIPSPMMSLLRRVQRRSSVQMIVAKSVHCKGFYRSFPKNRLLKKTPRNPAFIGGCSGEEVQQDH
jgi:hypothetical protein